jgi:hypothetical protein
VNVYSQCPVSFPYYWFIVWFGWFLGEIEWMRCIFHFLFNIVLFFLYANNLIYGNCSIKKELVLNCSYTFPIVFLLPILRRRRRIAYPSKNGEIKRIAIWWPRPEYYYYFFTWCATSSRKIIQQRRRFKWMRNSQLYTLRVYMRI